MQTTVVKYIGELRTESEHLQSGQKIMTDAPKDNEGKGEAFSPSDLLATSLANCMLTIMGILAKRQKILLEGTRAEVKKIMAKEPRRVAEIQINFFFPSTYEHSIKNQLEQAALNCPVAKSLASSIRQNICFHYNDKLYSTA